MIFLTLPQLSEKQINRFWQRVGITANPDKCWEWQGRCDSKMGYGQVAFGYPKSIEYKASRIAYFLFYGQQPNNLCVLHKCDNPPCVNPHHLFLGTHLDNTKDRQKKGRLNWSPETAPKGERNGQAKLNAEQVKVIKTMLAQGIKQKVIALEFHVCPANIAQIKRGARWGHIHI